MLILFAVAAFAAVAFFAVKYFEQNPIGGVTKNATTSGVPSAPNKTVPVVKQPAASPALNYSNAQYGITFQVPASWRGYSVKQDGMKLIVSLPGANGQSVNVMLLNIIPIATWNTSVNSPKCQNSTDRVACPYSAKYLLAKGSKYAVDYMLPKDKKNIPTVFSAGYNLIRKTIKVQ